MLSELLHDLSFEVSLYFLFGFVDLPWKCFGQLFNTLQNSAWLFMSSTQIVDNGLILGKNLENVKCISLFSTCTCIHNKYFKNVQFFALLS